jgi:uncharacterized protein YndB with AHSA1/START domain
MLTLDASLEPQVEQIETDLTLTRFYDAPRVLVYQMWTDPVHMAIWWGPDSVTTPVCEVDVRTGGTMRILMRGPDHATFAMTGTYRLVEPPRLLSFTSTAMDDDGNPSLDCETTVTFEVENGKTKMTVHTRSINMTEGAKSMIEGMETSWSQTLDRLGKLLNSIRPLEAGPTISKPHGNLADREIRFTRDLNAPRAVVFDAWTNPQPVSKWWGPDGFITTTLKMDVTPGGVWRFVMRGPDGVEYQNIITYLEIIEPLRLVYKHGGDSECEQVNFQVTVTFDDLPDHPGKTRLNMQMLFASRAEREFVIEKYGAIEGGKQTIHRLEGYLAKM